MYHRFEENKYPSTNIKINDFMAHINEIRNANLKFISFEEFDISFSENNSSAKVLLTVDDAFSSFYKNAWPILKEKGILYAPDFLINAGGLINVYSEINGYDREKAIAQTRKIYDTTLEIFSKSEEENITTHQAALKLAMERIAQAKN